MTDEKCLINDSDEFMRVHRAGPTQLSQYISASGTQAPPPVRTHSLLLLPLCWPSDATNTRMHPRAIDIRLAQRFVHLSPPRARHSCTELEPAPLSSPMKMRKRKRARDAATVGSLGWRARRSHPSRSGRHDTLRHPRLVHRSRRLTAPASLT